MNISIKGTISTLLFLSYLWLNCSAAERTYVNSVGLGYQFGSVLVGNQFSLKSDSDKIFASLGLVGYALGYQVAIKENDKNSIGLVVGQTIIPDARGGFLMLSYNYHFDGFSQKGWVIGVDAGMKKSDEYWSDDVAFEEDQLSTAIMLNIGYQF